MNIHFTGEEVSITEISRWWQNPCDYF